MHGGINVSLKNIAHTYTSVRGTVVLWQEMALLQLLYWLYLNVLYI